jgi:putative DNA primase/helicase
MTAPRELARGHWATLLPALGVDSRFLVNRHGPCPICGGADRFRWDNQHDLGGFICGQCGGGDGFDLARKVTGQTFGTILGKVEELLGKKLDSTPTDNRGEEYRIKTAMESIWRGSRPIADISPVAKYLWSRLGASAQSYRLLRGHSGLWVKEAAQKFPAMVAKVVSVEGQAINLHITFLAPNGEKASIERSKRVMPAKLPDGCAIRLMDEAPIMGVAEGIETAISASLIHGIPVWSCINGTLLAKWVPPACAEEIYVFGDNDRNFTGQAKAYQLANKLEVLHKVRANVLVPKTLGDWNDVLMAQNHPQMGAGHV